MTQAGNTVGRGWKFFFLAAGLLNTAGGTLGLLDPVKAWTDQGMAPPVGDVILRLLYCTVILFGLGYLMVWRHPLRHRGIVMLGLGTKILGFAFTYWAIAEGQMPESLRLQPLFVDLPWAIGFAWFLWRFRRVDRP